MGTAASISNPDGLIVCGFPVSQPSRSVYMLCLSAGIPFESVTINIMAGEHKSPEFLAINSAGLVPAIKEGELTLGEGAAILQYISESRGLANWYPMNPVARAKINYWLHWNHTATRMSTTSIFARRLWGDRQVISADIEKFMKHVAFLDQHLSTNKFLGGFETPTIADLMIVPEIDQVTFVPGLVDYSQYPNIVRYLADISTAVSAYEEVAAPVRDIVSARLAEINA